MNLLDLQKLSIEDKLSLLRTTGGLQMLQTALSEGNNLSQIANMLGVEPSALYRWKNIYPDINEVVAPYIRTKKPKTVPIDLSEPLAYRVIYAYDSKHSLKGFTMSEYDTLEAMWDSIFIQQYFGTFGLLTTFDTQYHKEYLIAMRTTGVYKLSNWYLLAYCSVDKRGKIIPQIPILKEV